MAGENYAQGSSREHAAIAPRYLGQVAVIAQTYARLGWQNLINFGIIPYEFINPNDYYDIDANDIIRFENLISNFINNGSHYAINETKGRRYGLKHSLSARQLNVILAGGVINYLKISDGDAMSVINKSES